MAADPTETLEGSIIQVVGQVARCVRNEGHSSSREIEVIEAEAEASNAFEGVVVETEVVAASLPAKLDVGIDDVSVKI